MNVGLIVMHWFLSAGVNHWIKNAPMPTKEAEPVKAVEAEPVADEDVVAEADDNNQQF